MKIFLFICNELFVSFKKHFSTYLKLITALVITFIAGTLTLKMAIKQYKEMQQLDINDRTYCLGMNGEITDEFLERIIDIRQSKQLGVEVENIEFHILSPNMIKVSENNYVNLDLNVVWTDDELKSTISDKQNNTVIGLYMSNALHESLWHDVEVGEIIEIKGLKFQICGFKDINYIHADAMTNFVGYDYVLDEICYKRVLDLNEMSILEKNISDIMGYCDIMSRKEKYSLDDIGIVRSNLQLIVLLFIACGINVLFIFKCIRNLEKEKICIYRICGAKPSLLFGLYVSEFFLCIIVGTCIGILGEYYLAQLEYFKSFTSDLSILQFFHFVFAFILLEFIINLPFFISLTRKNPVESMRT